MSRSGRNGTLAPKLVSVLRYERLEITGPSLIVPCCYRNSIDHSIDSVCIYTALARSSLPSLRAVGLLGCGVMASFVDPGRPSAKNVDLSYAGPKAMFSIPIARRSHFFCWFMIEALRGTIACYGACSTMSVVGTGQKSTLTATIALLGLRIALLVRKVRFRTRVAVCKRFTTYPMHICFCQLVLAVFMKSCHTCVNLYSRQRAEKVLCQALSATRGCGDCVTGVLPCNWLAILEIFWLPKFCTADILLWQCPGSAASTGLKKKEAWLYLKLSFQSGILGRLCEIVASRDRNVTPAVEALLLASVFKPSRDIVCRLVSRGQLVNINNKKNWLIWARVPGNRQAAQTRLLGLVGSIQALAAGKCDFDSFCFAYSHGKLLRDRDVILAPLFSRHLAGPAQNLRETERSFVCHPWVRQKACQRFEKLCDNA